MIQEVYIDLYFLINTSMNLLCLMITASLLHWRPRRLRTILAGALGGAYAAIALIVGLDGLIGCLTDIAVALLMCTAAFASKTVTIWRLLKCTLIQALTSMVLGGIMTALYTLLNRLQLPFEALQGDSLSVWSFALLTAVAGIATARGGRFFGLSQKAKVVTIQAHLFGHALTLHAMVDSGNLLRDPVSGRSVILADRAALLPVLPPALAKLPSNTSATAYLSDHKTARFIRLIPMYTASGEAVLPAFLPDKLTLNDGKNTYPADYLIAIAELGEQAQGFEAVVPAE